MLSAALPGGKSVRTGKAGEKQCAHRKGRGDSSHCPDCGEGEAICRLWSDRESREEAAAAAPSCAAPHRALCRGRFIKLRDSN